MKLLKRYSILVHRYLGVAFSLLFLLWFLSGIVMMYWDYPRVLPEERLASLEPLDASKVKITPAEAYAKSGLTTAPLKIRLALFEGRPVYRFHGPKRTQYAVYADTGEPFAVSEQQAQRAAAHFAKLPVEQARLTARMNDVDQWTLNKYVRPLMPYLKYEFGDPADTVVYVSAKTGEIQQRTTFESRFWGTLGAVIHWVYLTPIRKHTDFWRALIIATSAIGTIMTLLGIVVGLWLYSPSKRYKLRDIGPTAIPYAGWKRWHTIIGLAFGLVTFTWILSGMFSMNPMAWSPEFGPDDDHQQVLAGGPIRLDQFTLPASLHQAREVELIQFQGRPYYLAVRTPHDTTLIDSAGRAPSGIAEPDLRAAAATLIPGHRLTEATLLTEYDAYYIDRHHRDRLPILRVKYDDPAGTWHYLDPHSGRIAMSYVSTSRLNRWLYHGLHSLDFPLLYKYRPAWDATVLLLMSGGIALCVTSVWIAAKRLLKGYRDLLRRPIYTKSHGGTAADAGALAARAGSLLRRARS